MGHPPSPTPSPHRSRPSDPPTPAPRFLSLLAAFLCSLGGLTAAPSPWPVPIPSSPTTNSIFPPHSVVHFNLPSSTSIPSPLEWTLKDVDGSTVQRGVASPTGITLGKLETGYYELILTRPPAPTSHFTLALAVLPPSPPHASSPDSSQPPSPVALDAALSWIPQPHQRESLATLAANTGVSWIRDRLRWNEIEPQRGIFASSNLTDSMLEMQNKAGLKVLLSQHDTPPWAGPAHHRFAQDLRDVFHFHKHIARRWKNRLWAIEPWNEPDIDVFGGHTGSEIASYQKAAALGVKSVASEILVCQMPFATPRWTTLQDFQANEPWAYMDTFNIHHYLAPHLLESIYEPFLQHAEDRPIWVTECNYPLHWDGDENAKELNPSALQQQALRIPKLFSTTLQRGASSLFYFLLPHYAEGQNQYGLLRPDLSPRPAFVAFAAAARWLAHTTPAGRLRLQPHQHVHVFHTGGSSSSHELVVAWSDGESFDFHPHAPATSAWDLYGRPRPALTDRIRIDSHPQYLLFPSDPGEAPSWRRGHVLESLTPKRSPSSRRRELSPVVMQTLFDQTRTIMGQSCYHLPPNQTTEVAFAVYNFSDRPITGRIAPQIQGGWTVSSRESDSNPRTLPPFGREEIRLNFTPPPEGSGHGFAQATLRSHFPGLADGLLSFRLRTTPTNTLPRFESFLTDASDPLRWRLYTSGRAPLDLKPNQAEDGWITVTADPATDNRWAYPQFKLHGASLPQTNVNALRFHFELLEGTGRFTVILEEQNGSSYMIPFEVVSRQGSRQEIIARLDFADWGATWSLPDPNTQLDLDQVRALRIGCNTTVNRVKYRLKDLRWQQL